MTTLVADLATPATECTHVWMIDSPNGKQSFGRCRRCNGEKRFNNSNEDIKRDNNSDLFDRKRSSRRTHNDDGYGGVALDHDGPDRSNGRQRQMHGRWDDPTSV